MLSFGKTSGVVVAAMSYLATHYGRRPVSSREIAQARRLTPAHVAKVLSQLSALDWVKGSRGPGGGYSLTRAPASFSLAEIVEPFEKSRFRIMCPFGPGWCGTFDPCPLHDQMAALHEANLKALREMTLEAFVQQ